MTDVVGNPEEERRAEFYFQPWAQEAVCRYFYSKVSFHKQRSLPSWWSLPLLGKAEHLKINASLSPVPLWSGINTSSLLACVAWMWSPYLLLT